jgi:hypothetical protein
MGSSEVDEDQLLKSFLAEVSEAERHNEVVRSTSSSPLSALMMSFCCESLRLMVSLQISSVSRRSSPSRASYRM